MRAGDTPLEAVYGEWPSERLLQIPRPPPPCPPPPPAPWRGQRRGGRCTMRSTLDHQGAPQVRSTLLIAALLTLAGCAGTPEEEDGERPIPRGAEIARSVQLCRTPLSELTEKLGPPSRDGKLGDVRVITWIVEWDPLTRFLGVVVNDAGIVADVYWNLPSEVPWQPANRCP